MDIAPFVLVTNFTGELGDSSAVVGSVSATVVGTSPGVSAAVVGTFPGVSVDTSVPSLTFLPAQKPMNC